MQPLLFPGLAGQVLLDTMGVPIVLIATAASRRVGPKHVASGRRITHGVIIAMPVVMMLPIGMVVESTIPLKKEMAMFDCNMRRQRKRKRRHQHQR